MSLSRTWYDNVNLALPDTSTAVRSTASQLFNLKNQLVGALTGTSGVNGAPPSSSYWTIDSSCDSVTAGAGDNLGGSTFTAGKWVRAAAGSAHSWYVLKSPTTMTDQPWYLLVSFAASADQNAVVALSRNAFTGGTTTADPTSTNQAGYTTGPVHPNTTTAGKTHLVVDANGNFFFYSSKNSSGYCHYSLIGSTLVEARSSGDVGRFMIIQQFLDSGRGTPALYANSSTARGVGPTGTAPTAGELSVLSLTLAGTTLDTGLAAANLIDSKIDALPVTYIVQRTVGSQGVRGRVPDLWTVGATTPVGSGDPSTAAPTRIVLGGSLIPMGVAPGL